MTGRWERQRTEEDISSTENKVKQRGDNKKIDKRVKGEDGNTDKIRQIKRISNAYEY